MNSLCSSCASHSSEENETEMDNFDVFSVLSEASPMNNAHGKGDDQTESCQVNGLTELFNAQIALWTLSLTGLVSYLLRSPRRSLLPKLLFLVPLAILSIVLLAIGLTVVVLIGRLSLPRQTQATLFRFPPPTNGYSLNGRKSSRISLRSNDQQIEANSLLRRGSVCSGRKVSFVC